MLEDRYIINDIGRKRGTKFRYKEEDDMRKQITFLEKIFDGIIIFVSFFKNFFINALEDSQICQISVIFLGILMTNLFKAM